MRRSVIIYLKVYTSKLKQSLTAIVIALSQPMAAFLWLKKMKVMPAIR